MKYIFYLQKIFHVDYIKILPMIIKFISFKKLNTNFNIFLKLQISDQILTM